MNHVVLAFIVSLPLAFGFGSVSVSAESCFSIGQAYADDANASLVAAEPVTKDGVRVCEIVILKPASNGNRPKREVVTIKR